jgi:membrane protein DedA with SNARE-associated domain
MHDLLQMFIAWYHAYGYPVLFLGVLLENAGVPVPGETAVLIAAFLASPESGGHFNLAVVILLATLAAILGDNLGYLLGRRVARPFLSRGQGFLFLTPQRLQGAEHYFHRYGLWTILVARFILGLRVVAALAAGVADMHWPRFFLANATGALLWATAMSLLGYFFGRHWHRLNAYLGWGAWILLGAVVVLVVVVNIWTHLPRPRRQDPAKAHHSSGQPVA